MGETVRFERAGKVRGIDVLVRHEVGKGITLAFSGFLHYGYFPTRERAREFANKLYGINEQLKITLKTTPTLNDLKGNTEYVRLLSDYVVQAMNSEDSE